MTSKTDISTGTTTARMDKIVDTMSSAMLTGTLPAPPVVAVTAGRTAAALTAWTLPATIRPAASESTGWISVITLALVGEGGGTDVEIESSSAADVGNTMRSAGSGQYIFNLSTKRSQFNGGQDLTPGQYQLTITGSDLQEVMVGFTIRP